MKYIFLLYLLNITYILSTTKKITTKPSVKHYNHILPLFWKVGKSEKLYKGDLHRFIFDDYPICIYRDMEDNVKAISDICIHRGASLAYGKLLNNNCVQCPYHGWEYKNGLVKTVPGCLEMKKL